MGNRKRGLRFSLLTSGAKLSTLPTQRSRITSRLRCRDRAQGRSGGLRFAFVSLASTGTGWQVELWLGFVCAGLYPRSPPRHGYPGLSLSGLATASRQNPPHPAFFDLPLTGMAISVFTFGRLLHRGRRNAAATAARNMATRNGITVLPPPENKFRNTVPPYVGKGKSVASLLEWALGASTLMC